MGEAARRNESVWRELLRDVAATQVADFYRQGLLAAAENTSTEQEARTALAMLLWPMELIEARLAECRYTIHEPIKVTEFVGRHRKGPEWDDFDVGPRKRGGCLCVSDLLPNEALARMEDVCDDVVGPRGRFRITVEFWPDPVVLTDEQQRERLRSDLVARRDWDGLNALDIADGLLSADDIASDAEDERET